MKFPSNAWLNTRVQFVSFKILKMFKKGGGRWGIAYKARLKKKTYSIVKRICV